MPRQKLTTEQRENRARDKIVSRDMVIHVIDLTEEEIDAVVDKMYDDVILKAQYGETSDGLNISPGKLASEFTMEEHRAMYFYEHHKGEAGRKKIEEIVSFSLMPLLGERAYKILKNRGSGGCGKYLGEDGQPSRILVDDMKQEGWLEAQTQLRYNYDPIRNGKTKFTSYIFRNVDYAMVKFLGDLDNISMKDNQALGQMSQMEDYLEERGIKDKRPADYVFAAEMLGFNGWTEKKAERLSKERRIAVADPIDALPLSVNFNIEDTVIRDEREQMINIILDQIGEYDKFAKWALLAYEEYSPPAGTDGRSSETKGKMKHIKDFFVKHYYPKEKYGDISVKTFTRLLQIAYDEFRYRSELLNFFKREKAEGGAYGLNLDYDDTLKSYMEDIEMTIEEYNQNDYDYEFDQKYIP